MDMEFQVSDFWLLTIHRSIDWLICFKVLIWVSSIDHSIDWLIDSIDSIFVFLTEIYLRKQKWQWVDLFLSSSTYAHGRLRIITSPCLYGMANRDEWMDKGMKNYPKIKCKMRNFFSGFFLRFKMTRFSWRIDTFNLADQSGCNFEKQTWSIFSTGTIWYYLVCDVFFAEHAAIPNIARVRSDCRVRWESFFFSQWASLLSPSLSLRADAMFSSFHALANVCWSGMCVSVAPRGRQFTCLSGCLPASYHVFLLDSRGGGER